MVRSPQAQRDARAARAGEGDGEGVGKDEAGGMMNCPECGRFMHLAFAGELGMYATDEGVAYFWQCTNIDNCLRASRDILIPEHKYDWWLFCSSIPREVMDDWPELAAECAIKLAAYGDAIPRGWATTPPARE